MKRFETFSKRSLFSLAAALALYSCFPHAAYSASPADADAIASARALRASDIESAEKDLEEFARGLAKKKLTITDLDQAYTSLIQDMTPEQRRSFAKNDLEALPASLRERAKNYQTLQLNVDKALGDLMERTDGLVKIKLDYIIDVTMNTHQVIKQNVLPDLINEHFQQAIKPSMDKLENLFTAFKESRSVYGQPIDGPTRITFYRKFFAQVQQFDKKLAELESKRQIPAAKISVLRRARETLGRVFAELANLAKLIPEMGRMARVAFLPKASKPGKIDFTANLNKSFRKFAEVMGVSVEIEGREKIPAQSDPKVVNVFAPTHRHPTNDSLIMSHIMPDDALLFGAGDQFVPGGAGKFLANLLDKADGFVMVGRGSDKPIEEAVEQMKSTGSRNLFIYPEGAVSTGLGETRPPRPKFSTGLLNRLKSEGYKVNLIPITYTNADRVLHLGGLGPEGEEKTLRAKIHDPLTPERVEMMLSSGDEQMVNRYLRGVWLSDLPTDENRISGQWRFSVLNKIVPEKLYQGPARSWSLCIQSEIMERLSR